MLPPKGGPNFALSAEDNSEQHALSVELKSMVKGRAAVREIIIWTEEKVFPVHGLEVTLKVVVQTLLDIGSKSFTHLITVLERYFQVIAKICPDQDKQVMLITEVASYWKNNTQMTAIAIDRMMGYRLLSNLSIVRWVFSPENIEQFHTSDRPWEVWLHVFTPSFRYLYFSLSPYHFVIMLLFANFVGMFKMSAHFLLLSYFCLLRCYEVQCN